MKKLIFVLILLIPSIAFAETYIDGYKYDDVAVLSINGKPSAPSVAGINQGRMYYNTGSDTVELSLNGNAYSSLLSWANAVNSDLIPDTDNSYDIGSSTKEFKDGYFDGTLEADILTEGGVAVYNDDEMDTEAKLEGILTDVTDLFTNNDGALTDDDITNDVIGSLSNVVLTTPTSGEPLEYNGTNWINATDNDTTYTAGTNLSLVGTTLNVDDAFLTNDASDLLSASTDGTTELIIRNTDGTLAAETYLLELQQTDDGSTYGDFIKCTDAYGGTPATLFNVEYNGNVTSAGTIEGATLTEGGNAVYNSTETPGGELGGTWASPTVDSAIHDDEYVELGDSFSGDITGAYNATAISAGVIIETDLDGDVAPIDGDFLQYDATGTNFTWRSGAETLSDIGAEGDLVNEAGLYAALSDVTQFYEAGDENTIVGAVTAGAYADDSIQAADIDTINGGTNATWNITTDAIDVDDAFLLNTGDIGTGAYDFGGATSLEIPNSAAPTTNAEGQIAWDTGDDMLEVYDGTQSVVVGRKLKLFSATIYDPDALQVTNDAMPILPVEVESFPAGITLVDVGIKTDASSTYSVNFEEWLSPTDATPSTIETVATAASTEAEDDGTLTDSAIAAGSIIYVDLPVTNINMLVVWGTYYVNDN